MEEDRAEDSQAEENQSEEDQVEESKYQKRQTRSRSKNARKARKDAKHPRKGTSNDAQLDLDKLLPQTSSPGESHEYLDAEFVGDPEHQRVGSPLFFSESSSLETRPQPEPLGGNRIAVVVPPVQRRWEYRVYHDDRVITKILAQRRDPYHFVVRYQDGRTATLPLIHLRTINGGSVTLRRFNNRVRGTSRRLDSPDSVEMVNARQIKSRRQLPQGFVDSSNLALSDEDELSTTKVTHNYPTRRKRLLSSPDPTRRGQHSQSPDAQSTTSRSSSSEADSNDLSDVRDRASKRRRLHAMRSTTNKRVNYKEIPVDVRSSSNESGSDAPRSRRRTRAQSRNTKDVRRSERTGRAVKNMQEKGDDIPETLIARSKTRFAGAKETFKAVPFDDELRLRHCLTCAACNDRAENTEKGPMIYCQGCTFSYHQVCLGPRAQREHLVTKVGDKDFVLQCRYCINLVEKRDPTAPHQGVCQVCHEAGPACAQFKERKTPKIEQKEREENDGVDPITEVPQDKINQVQNVLFRCSSCWRAFHMHHLPARKDGDAFGNRGMEVADIRFGEYCRDWLCQECLLSTSEIEGLVAWRPVDLVGNSVSQTEDLRDHLKEYLIKWCGVSYFGVTWMPGAWVWANTVPAMRKAFHRKDHASSLLKLRTEDAIPEGYLRIDIVLDVEYTNLVRTTSEEVEKARVKEVKGVLAKFKGLEYKDVVWEQPPDPEDTERWLDFKSAYEDWVRGHHITMPKQRELMSRINALRVKDFEKHVEVKGHPDVLTGGKLMEYQVEGMNWLLYRFHQGKNAMLADEMGLGKTIQVIGFLATLQRNHGCWPFLIVVPNSTCANWRREIKQWAPSLRVVAYFGTSEAREAAHKYELFPRNRKDPRGSSNLTCHVVVTSYEAAQDPACLSVFRRVPWAGLVVDEGQRLKNKASLLYAALDALQAPFKLLLTGTPLQNSLKELFNLIQFLDKSIDANSMDEEYGELTNEKVASLHELLKPFILRRTKAEKLDFLPPVAQIIVPVTMTSLQKVLCKSILAKDPRLIEAVFIDKKLEKSHRAPLANILIQLRKCLCHPYLYSDSVEERELDSAVLHKNLVEASSKLQLLNIMLPKLKERGHRVLIFSQFLGMLRIVEDFMDGLALEYERLDGSIGAHEKQKRIDRFNAPNSSVFAFLLSTRAGGVGINLATADTVIILDPDWNPHQDIQALSRAHRIGQTKKVLVFQLMSRATAEEKIMQIGRKKMALDQAVIEHMDRGEDEDQDIESIIRHGAESLFGDDDTNDIRYTSDTVDKLLDRSQVEQTQPGKDKSAESQFSVAQVWRNDKESLDGNLEVTEEQASDASKWDQLIQQRQARDQIDKEASTKMQESFGRGKRSRQKVNYSGDTLRAGHFDSPNKRANGDSDTDFQESDGDDSAEDKSEDLGEEEHETPQRSRSRGIVGATGAQSSTTPTKVRTFERPQQMKVQPRSLLHQAEHSSPTQSARLSYLKESARAMPPSKYPPGVAQPLSGPHPAQPQVSLTNGAATAKGNGFVTNQPPCLACNKQHPLGSCPLKIAGVEKCGLCGLAHYGYQRTCPHLNSETQVRVMLANVRISPEDPHIKKCAETYLRGVLGGLVRKKAKRRLREQQQVPLLTTAPLPPQTNGFHPQTNDAPRTNGSAPSLVVDLTGDADELSE